MEAPRSGDKDEIDEDFEFILNEIHAHTAAIQRKDVVSYTSTTSSRMIPTDPTHKNILMSEKNDMISISSNVATQTDKVKKLKNKFKRSKNKLKRTTELISMLDDINNANAMLAKNFSLEKQRELLVEVVSMLNKMISVHEKTISENKQMEKQLRSLHTRVKNAEDSLLTNLYDLNMTLAMTKNPAENRIYCYGDSTNNDSPFM